MKLGYEKQKGTQQGQENSRMYNEMAILKMVQVSLNTPEILKDQISGNIEKSNGASLAQTRFFEVQKFVRYHFLGWYGLVKSMAIES